jgi:hypothetical protein
VCALAAASRGGKREERTKRQETLTLWLWREEEKGMARRSTARWRDVIINIS